MSKEITASEKTSEKKLSALDLFLGVVCLMLFLDTATSSSAMGPTSITWYLILAVLFFIPAAMVTAELAATYPGDGGLYSWVKISLGDNWASRVSWYYWLNNAVWVSSATIFIMDVVSEMLANLFGIEISFFVYILLSIALVWVYVFLALQPLKESTFVTNIGGIAKLTIVGGLVICAICYLIFNQGETASNLALSEFKPSLGAAFVFFPALIYNLMGFDSIAAIGGSNIENPGKDLPRVIITNVLLLTVFYIIANLAILIITPMENIDIINGLLNCFTLTFNGSLGIALYVIVGILFLYSLLSQGPAWLQAAGNMAIEAADHQELPKVFATRTKKGTALGASVLIGVVSTILITAYGFLAGGVAENLFWTLFSFNSFIFLIPYILMFSAFLKLRKTDEKTKRPFRFPGSYGFAAFVSRFDQIILITTLVLFFWVPGTAMDWLSAITLAIGIGIGLLLGEIFNYQRKKKLQSHK